MRPTHRPFQVLSLFIVNAAFSSRTPLRRHLKLAGGGKEEQKAFFVCLLFAPKSIFSVQIPELWHFSSRLQRERRMLFAPAQTATPGVAGCSPVTSRNHRNPKTTLRCLLLWLATMFLSLRRLQLKEIPGF